MTLKDKTGREVEIEIGGKYSDDIEVYSAVYVDTGEDASDETVDYLTNTYNSEIHQEWLENQIGAAESLCEGDR